MRAPISRYRTPGFTAAIACIKHCVQHKNQSAHTCYRQGPLHFDIMDKSGHIHESVKVGQCFE